MSEFSLPIRRCGGVHSAVDCPTCLMQDERDGLVAALFIAREGESIAKERLNSVSEQLVGAHQEIDRLRQQITELQAMPEWIKTEEGNGTSGK
jgi:hypothetical protein